MFACSKSLKNQQICFFWQNPPISGFKLRFGNVWLEATVHESNQTHSKNLSFTNARQKADRGAEANPGDFYDQNWVGMCVSYVTRTSGAPHGGPNGMATIVCGPLAEDLTWILSHFAGDVHSGEPLGSILGAVNAIFAKLRFWLGGCTGVIFPKFCENNIIR